MKIKYSGLFCLAIGLLGVAAILQLLDSVRGGAKARPLGE